MRMATVLCLFSAVLLAGCSSGGCCTAYQPCATPAYGSASATHASADQGEIIWESEPYFENEAPRPATRRPVARVAAPTRARTVANFVPPSAPCLPKRVCTPCEPVECQPVFDPCANECCPGGNCGIPSANDCCPGGNCGIPSLDPCAPAFPCGK
jgi:hypothetical protein